ncbi:FMN-binding protein [Sulfurimonas sp. SAG-AH-194-L11]|nr:FMN-binding protein [Sulfurimonas sp. SAG-AH-194-L11]MDF1876695.1 FMN-binding protein [Sulfurimonas sp. SAG-AH-194-L11]
MKKLLLILLILSISLLQAKILVSPLKAMQEEYDLNATITKKNILLSNKKFKDIQTNAKTKLDTKIYRIFTAKKDDKTLGYGILVSRKVRSKNAVVLYFIKNNQLQGIDIIAFNESMEYITSNTWNKQLQGTSTDKMLRLNRDIPSISGATMSARSVIEGSRIAFAIYNELLKGK